MLPSLYQGIDFDMLMPCLLQLRKLFSSCKPIGLDRARSDLAVQPYILSV